MQQDTVLYCPEREIASISHGTFTFPPLQSQNNVQYFEVICNWLWRNVETNVIRLQLLV